MLLTLLAAALLLQPRPLGIVTTVLPDAAAGKPYRFTLQATGGREPYTWKPAALPPQGLALNPVTGEISGTPSFPGFFNLSVRVTDSSRRAQTAAATFTLNVVDQLVVETAFLPGAVLREPYRLQLRARGGIPPLKWEISSGTLPPGLELNRATGLLSGTPTAGGEFVFNVRVTDAANPPQTATRAFSGKVTIPLAVNWKRPPRVEQSGIFGSVEVSNGLRQDFDLTVIVVAVNEYGKAFALGYEHFLLRRESISPEIPFGFSLPLGSYHVHVDAVAEVEVNNAIYRARQQHGPLRLE